jgi:dolichyl-phosphate beta-glucosyltransferase
MAWTNVVATVATWMGVFLGIVFVIAAAVAYKYSRRYTTTRPAKDKVFTKFGNKVDQGPSLSIVVPCYNEEERLPPMLKHTIEFCRDAVQRCTDDRTSREEGLFSAFEIVVVDDCSTDGTAKVVEKFQSENKDVTIKLVRVKPNRGKGHAVRRGFFEASGDYVLMADGDNATEISDVTKLLKALRKPAKVSAKKAQAGHLPPVVAVGSRAHMEQKSIANRTLGRTILMKLFHFVVNVTYTCGTRGTICPIHDTQCGFKLFDRRVCEILFINSRLERFAFDVEILILARRQAMKAVEVQVKWEEIPGSKVNLRGMVQMGVECLLMCFTYGLGMWSIRTR